MTERLYRQEDEYGGSAGLGFFAERAEEILRCCATSKVPSLLFKQLTPMSRFCGQATRRLIDRPGKKKVDEGGSIRGQLLDAQLGLKSFYGKLVGCRESAINDAELHEDDGVIEAFNQCIHAVVDLHNHINELRWTIGEHDADLAKVVGTFATAEELTKHLQNWTCGSCP